jgi:transcriptional regulator with XRE-family HTH domain
LSSNVYIVKPSHAAPTPLLAKPLRELGERLQLARLRRRYSAETVAVRAGVTRMTLYKVEKGDPTVSMGTYANVLRVLGLHEDLGLLARDDVLGRKLQDLELPVRKIAPARSGEP